MPDLVVVEMSRHMNVSPVTQTPVQPHNGHSGQLAPRNAEAVTSLEHAWAHQLVEISKVNSVTSTHVNGWNGECGVYAMLQLVANLVSKSAQDSVMVISATERALSQISVLSNVKIESMPDLGTIEDFVEEINTAKATAEPQINDSENCFTLNVNGDCLDHLEYVKEDTIVAVGSCSLPAFIIQNDQIMGQAEFITDTKVRYRCMDSYRLRGPKNLECKCRGRNCRQQPKKTPKCIKDSDKHGRKIDGEHYYDDVDIMESK